jgi:four helix bundle protein
VSTTGKDIRSYKDLKVWQEAKALAEDAYRATRRFPKDESYGMTSQIRRAAVSVAANIAEGHGREGAGHFIQSLRVAQGSLKELETHFLLAERVGILPADASLPLIERCNVIGRMLRALLRAVQAKAQ